MAIQPICKMGNTVLAIPSAPVENFHHENIAELLKDMHDTMKKAKGVGIAAPQIGVGKRVIIVGFEHDEEIPEQEEIPLTILINPRIEVLDQEMVEEWEGCLSVPGLRGVVPRYKKIKYTGQDLSGKEISGIAEGFHARIFQHECDHVDGILYPQRIQDLRLFAYEDELIKRIQEMQHKKK